jgi:hypothetical protein
MNSPAKDIADKLQALVIGTFGTNIFVSEEPKNPNDCVTIYDTGGSGDAAFADIELYQPTIQVRVRNKTYPLAYAKQEQIRDALIIPITFTINSAVYLGIWLQSDIISLGRDDNNRYILTANYRIERQPV